MPFQHIDFGVDDVSLDRDLQFPCQSVVVDNYTNQYLHLLGDFQDFIPPYTLRAIYQSKTTRIAKVKFEAPPGLTQAPIIADQSASLDYYPEALDPTTGTTLTPFAEQEVLGTITQGGIAGSQRSGTFNVPPGTHGVGILIQQTGDFIEGINFSEIDGVQSGAIYIKQNVTWEQGLTIVPIASAIDTSVTITLIAGTPRTGAKAWIIAIKDVEAIQTYGGVPFAHDPFVDQGQGNGPGAITPIPWATSKQPYDGIATNGPAVNVQANATLAGVAGVTWVISAFSCKVGGAGGATLGLLSGIVICGASTLWLVLGGISGVGALDGENYDNQSLEGIVSTAVTAQMNSAANDVAYASIAGYRY